jgi:hypothetical protein
VETDLCAVSAELTSAASSHSRLGFYSKTTENDPMNVQNKRAIPRGDALPTKGYAVAVDMKIKSEYDTAEAAFKAAAEIKRKFPVVQVTVYDAEKGTRSPVEVETAAVEIETPAA